MLIIYLISIVRALTCGFVMAVSFSAYADVYLCKDEAGVVSLSNVDSKKSCKKMKLQPKPKNAPSYTQDGNNNKNQSDGVGATNAVPMLSPSPADAAAERKRIVLEELGLEKRRLETVLNQVASAGIRTESEAERQKYLSSVKKKESLHRSNIELLEKEFSRLK